MSLDITEITVKIMYPSGHREDREAIADKIVDAVHKIAAENVDACISHNYHPDHYEDADLHLGCRNWPVCDTEGCGAW